jgi:hypothetical protein
MITRHIAMHQHGTELEHINRIVRFGLRPHFIRGALVGGSLMIMATWLAKS